MMNLYQTFPRLSFLFIALACSVHTARAQSGDQILDGIGETGMIARYVFNGDVKDWSRNTLHGKVHGSGVTFVNDSRFGQVLSLGGTQEGFITLPAEALNDLESLSISGWIYLRSAQPGQQFFDFGNAAAAHFFAAPSGTKARKGYQVGLTSAKGMQSGTLSAALALNTWVHLAVVIDVPSKTMTSYLNGEPLGEATNIAAGLTDLLTQGGGPKKQLYIGKSMVAGDPDLHALIHDFRIYRVPLNRDQVAGIYANANGGAVNTTVRVKTPKHEDDLPHFAPDAAQLYNTYLLQVADIKVETALGDLPRLPVYVEGSYKNKMKGPPVRVLWPSATDNSAVLKAGFYTITGRVPGTTLQPRAVVTVKASAKTTAPTRKLEAFGLDHVLLEADADGHETQFIENRDKFLRTLATTDPNSFLYMFRDAFGQKQPAGATPLGVWDSEDTKLRGHATGHYLTAIAQAYAGTSDNKTLHENFAAKMDYMVNTLYALSELSGKPLKAGAAYVSDPAAVPHGPGKTEFDSDLSETGIRTDYWNWGQGFISAYPPDQFIMLESGAKYGGQKNQVWAPYYTLHKILAGLIDVYEVSGNKKALLVASHMGDWVYARLSKLPQETLIRMWNTYIAGEFGGMNESMAHLYKLTGDQKYLKTAQLFDNIKVFFGDTAHTHGLAKNVDVFRGLHANQHIPQIVGSIALYNVSQQPEYYKVADNFWHKITSDYMYSIGGVAGARNPANAECFVSQPATLYENGFSEGGQNETCATYNMLKLTGDLFLFDQRAEYMDYYERGLYNDILASVAENSPANTYHISLRPGAAKQFGNGDMTGFTCCNGTALESSTKLQNSIYFRSKDNDALYVNLFIPSKLDWAERGIRVEQTTDFPREDHTRLLISGNGKFDMHVRVPGWATKGFTVTINGKIQQVAATPGSYLKISRKWKDGDVVELQMPFQFHLDPVMDQQNIASLFYGPILLAAQEPEARKEWRKVTLDAEDLGKSIQGDPKSLTFTIDDIVYKPFYESYGRSSVYLDVTLK